MTQTYTFDTTLPTVTATPAGSTFNTAQSITLTASEPSTIYFTTYSTDPTISSKQYTAPINL